MKQIKAIMAFAIVIFLINILSCNNLKVEEKENEDTTNIRVDEVTRINSALYNNPEIQKENEVQIGWIATQIVVTTPARKMVEETTIAETETEPEITTEVEPEVTTETELETTTEQETTMVEETTTVETQPKAEPKRTYEGIVAKYTGDNLREGEPIDKSKITVVSRYSDGYTEDVPISDFTVSPITVEKSGWNIITVKYAGKTATIKIAGIPIETKREIETTVPETKQEQPTMQLIEVLAEYKGEALPQGSEIDQRNIKVTALYSEGYFEDVPLYHFTISPTTVTKVGDNEVTVMYGGKSTTIIVVGLEP